MTAPAANDRLLAGDWQANLGNKLDDTGAGRQEFSDLAKAITNQWGEAEEDHGKRKALEYIYWRKCARAQCFRHSDKNTGVNLEQGWVTVGPSEASDPRQHDRYIRSKHMEPLPQYGAFPVGEASSITNHRLRFAELMNKGGVMEFPVAQMQAYGWDKLPIILRFRPDIVLQRIPCRYGCIGRDFVSNEGMREHLKVVHPDMMVQEATAETLRAAIEMLGEKMIAANQPQVMDPTVMATTLALAIKMAESGSAGIVPAGMSNAQMLQAEADRIAAEKAAPNTAPRSGKNKTEAVAPPPPSPDNVAPAAEAFEQLPPAAN